MKKAIITLGLFLTVISLAAFPKKLQAESNFITDINVEYSTDETGKSLVKNTITIENASSEFEAKSFVFTLQSVSPKNPSAYEGGLPLKFTQETDAAFTSLHVYFERPVVGQGKTRVFEITYEDEGNFAVRTGEVWEIAIPRLESEDTFRSYGVTLLVPESFGNEAYMSPAPKSVINQDKNKLYSFGQEAEKTGITAAFGQFQIFSFSLNYHLENPVSKDAETEIAIPPDTSLQKVYYDGIDPAPDVVYIDTDGNWLAKYILKPKKRLEVTVKGSVQIFSTPYRLTAPSEEEMATYTAPSKYWQSDDLELKAIAQSLGTPQAIYDYVVKTLSYDYERVRPNVVRLGAKEALRSPKAAICMEYTDLFIALARAAGIPTREINGYAYTENPSIQPLSLVADVLHSWPEYYSYDKKTWIPVDPTWGSTTGGVDYFSKLDLRHFAFVIHGKDDSKPYPPGSYKLGPNPQKDVYVNFGIMPSLKRGNIEITTTGHKLSPLSNKIDIKIKNTGFAAFYNLTPNIFFDQEKVSAQTIAVLPPYAEFETSITIPYGLLALKSPSVVKIVADKTQLVIPTRKAELIVYQLLGICLILILVLFAVHLSTGKIRLSKVRQKHAKGKTQQGKSKKRA